MIRSLLARLRIYTKGFANNLGKVRELFLICSRTFLGCENVDKWALDILSFTAVKKE